jgi:transposase-like protein
MTMCSNELRRLGVSETLISFRQWRRKMHVSIPEAAAMAGVSRDYLQHLESGRERPKRSRGAIEKLEALMARWQGARKPDEHSRRPFVQLPLPHTERQPPMAAEGS